MTKIGLDIHGVIDADPDFFVNLASRYSEVHIITGGRESKELIDELLSFNNGKKFWTHFFSVYDHLEKTRAKTNKELGIASRYPFPDTTWNKVKGIYCKENQIDLHYDDMKEYIKHFSTPVCLYRKDPSNPRPHRGK